MFFAVYPPGGMIEMSNGYPPTSPLGGSPSPGPSPGLGVSGKSGHPRHSPQPPPQKANLRVVIPTSLTQSLADETSYDVIVIKRSQLSYSQTIAITFRQIIIIIEKRKLVEN